MLTHNFTIGLKKISAASGAGSLDFSSLPNLPVSRQAAVQAAANAAATTLGVSTQSIIDALAVGRGFASFLPNDGCLLASSGGFVTTQGDPVGAIRSWTGVELATQSNASLQPTSGADGITFNGTKEMNLGDLSLWSEGEALTIHSTSDGRIYAIGSNNQPGSELLPFNNGRFFTTFGGSLPRSISPLALAVPNPSAYAIVQTRMTNGGNLVLLYNGGEQINETARVVLFSSSARLYIDPANTYAMGTQKAFLLNSSVYTANQRSAVREFCKEYYGIVY